MNPLFLSDCDDYNSYFHALPGLDRRGYNRNVSYLP